MKMFDNSFPCRFVVPLLVICSLAFVCVESVQAQQPVPPKVPAVAPVLLPLPAVAAVPTPTSAKDAGGLINFTDAPMEVLLDFYSEITGKTILRSPGLGGTVRMRVKENLPRNELADLIEGYLVMCGVAIVEDGKVLRAVPIATAYQEIQVITDYDTAPPSEKARGVMTRRFQLKYLEALQAQRLLQPLMHAFGLLQAIEGVNAIVVTDTAPNLRKMKALLDYADQPVESALETRIYELRNRRPSILKTEFDALLSGSLVLPARNSTYATTPSQPGLIRARVVSSTPADMETSLVRGSIYIMADDGTGVLFVAGRPENFAFFDKLIAVLDRPTKQISEPDGNAAANDSTRQTAVPIAPPKAPAAP